MEHEEGLGHGVEQELEVVRDLHPVLVFAVEGLSHFSLLPADSFLQKLVPDVVLQISAVMQA